MILIFFIIAYQIMFSILTPCMVCNSFVLATKVLIKCKRNLYVWWNKVVWFIPFIEYTDFRLTSQVDARTEKIQKIIMAVDDDMGMQIKRKVLTKTVMMI